VPVCVCVCVCMRSGVSSSHPHFYAADSESDFDFSSEERPHLVARLLQLLDVSVTRFCILRLVSVALKFMQHHGCCCCCCCLCCCCYSYVAFAAASFCSNQTVLRVATRRLSWVRLFLLCYIGTEKKSTRFLVWQTK